jgi:hypothetical protein
LINYHVSNVIFVNIYKSTLIMLQFLFSEENKVQNSLTFALYKYHSSRLASYKQEPWRYYKGRYYIWRNNNYTIDTVYCTFPYITDVVNPWS